MSMYDIIIGGTCHLCGVRHPGQTCKEHQDELATTVKRVISKMGLKRLAGEEPSSDPTDASR